VVFLNQLSGPVREALDGVVARPVFSYGVAQRTGGLAVLKPDGSTGLLPFGYLGRNAPPPFRAEWDGATTGRSNMVHHKFVVTDFNTAHPMVFTGSSNMAAGGERANGDNLICIQDRRVAAAYAIEALRLFDHFHFRVKQREVARERAMFGLRKPPLPGRKAWFDQYYEADSVKLRDRRLFAG
jgi:phosphatidylserine/phosphatidylglycerophosphate/cardiolipin synthase-like enzyme